MTFLGTMMNIVARRVVFNGEKNVSRTIRWKQCVEAIKFGGSNGTIRRMGATTTGRRKVVVVGSGPSGCYVAKYLGAAWDRAQIRGQIDIIERLPTPYGLVRFGVAPDHPEVKNVQNDFDLLFQDKGVNYFGNVEVGRDVSLQELRERYDAVVLATGSQSDKRLGLPNEESISGILSAREFVAWYNGHPDFVHIGEQVKASFGGTTVTEDQVRNDVSVVIVGHGNVAMDCARVLAKGGKALHDTDIASHVLPVLGNGVAQVTLVGRRGHIQGAFTIKELRELVTLQEEGFDTSFVVREDELDLGATQASLQEMALPGGRPKQRINALLRETASRPYQTCSKRIDLRFLTNPHSWEPSGSDPTRLGALICERTRLEGESGAQTVVGTGIMERIPAQLALLSIGYKGALIPGLREDQFNADRGTVKHERGCIEKATESLGGLYAAGWFKRGPSGIIGTNIPDARETVSSILVDLEAIEASRERSGDLKALLQQRGVPVIDWEAYQHIEQRESARKRSPNQPREKITDWKELIQTALG